MGETFWDVPDWVPPADGFWPREPDGSMGGTWSHVRVRWLAKLSTEAARCATTACASRAAGALVGRVSPYLTEVFRFEFGLLTSADVKRLTDAATPFQLWPAVPQQLAVEACRMLSRFHSASGVDFNAPDLSLGGLVSAGRVGWVAGGADAGLDASDAYAVAVLAAACRGDALDRDALSRERMNQARLLRLFVPPADPVRSGDAVGIAREWLAGRWAGHDDALARAVLADALEEVGFADGPVLRALRELPAWYPGMWPVTPEYIK